jgi:ABC-type phosphate transport system ATPase subunit
MAADKCGELIERGATTKLFSDPADPRTLDYLSGRFG